MITREELKAHCEEQVAKCEAFWAEDEEKLKNHKLYQEHKLVLELLEQVPKTGKWIEEVNDFGEVTAFHCSNCYEDTGLFTKCKFDFCPKCGAIMESEADNESKTEEQGIETTG